MDEKSFDEIVENLFLTVGLIKRKILNHDLNKECELTPLHIHILFTIKCKEVLTISELAKQLDISKPNITPLIQKLIDKGYVERITDERDRRFIHIKLTNEGKEFLTRHKGLIIQDLRSKIADLSETDLEKLGVATQYLRETLGKIK